MFCLQNLSQRGKLEYCLNVLSHFLLLCFLIIKHVLSDKLLIRKLFLNHVQLVIEGLNLKLLSIDGSLVLVPRCRCEDHLLCQLIFFLEEQVAIGFFLT